MAVYLFYGEETYLLETKVKRLKKDFGELVQGINYIQIDDTNVEELISDIETPAFGFPKKLILAKNTGLFKKEKKTKKTAKTEKLPLTEKISEYLEDNIKIINETVELIFIEETAEKNDLYKTIEKIGEVKEFTQLKLPDLIQNLKKIAMAYKVTIDDNSAKYLVECCGTSMQDLINEIRKLIEYKGEGGNITKEDIDKLCIKQIQAIIFDLTDSLGEKQTRKSIRNIQRTTF